MRIGSRAATRGALYLVFALGACAGSSPASHASPPSANAVVAPDADPDAGSAGALAPASADVRDASDSTAGRARAEHDLPGLFAKCAASRAVIQRWRVADVGAERMGNYILGEQAHAEIDKESPAWRDTLGKIRDTIRGLTNDHGPRFVQLIRRVDAECDCKATASGRCG